MVVYFLSFAIVFLIVTGIVIYHNGLIFGPFPFNLLITEIFFSLPAIPSSFITSYLNKKCSDGILVVGISGFIVILLISLIIGGALFIEFTGPPPADQWEGFGRMILILVIPFLYLFFIFPIAIISTLFARLSASAGSQHGMDY